jgi:hypothetical protein
VTPPSVERQRVEDVRLRLVDIDRLESARGDDEQCRAVRLDQVRLVDALFLDVRAGVVDTLGRARACRSSAGGGSSDSGR